ncbi:MAG: bifunctional folylpolyglutamate synthase/dihydrofolate synthase [Halobacteriota archaeon]
MHYHESVEFLVDLGRVPDRRGTDEVAGLLSELGAPQTEVAFVQVAGSNGKGSTARMTESILRQTDDSIGLFTSPHLETLRERIRVDGRMISKGAIAEFTDRVQSYLLDRSARGTPLTFFEVVTAMGIWYFAREGVDVAVLEVGIGGEDDATSVVEPIAGCVTNVTCEHTDVLGGSIEEIARAKAKIAPRGKPLVTGATGAALDVVETIVDEVDGTVLTVGGRDADVTARYVDRVTHRESRVSIDADEWSIDATIPHLGRYQADNAGIATTLARAVVNDRDGDLDDRSIERGLARADWPGRFDVVSTDPLVVLDGAHNRDACRRLAETLSTFEYERLHLVFGAMSRKDHRAMVEALPPVDTAVTCAPALDRAADADVLHSVVVDVGVPDVTAAESVAEAVSIVRRRAAPADCILLAGSLFLIAEARPAALRLNAPKRV